MKVILPVRRERHRDLWQTLLRTSGKHRDKRQKKTSMQNLQIKIFRIPYERKHTCVVTMSCDIAIWVNYLPEIFKLPCTATMLLQFE